ncbi:MAG: hypothetical protein IJL93_04880 [Bacteroidales bacterium]|nr:hypothetical protein [Bacteroidales bacterium]
MNSNILCYIPMLEGQTGEVKQWLTGVRESYGVIPVMLPPVAWNDDLTPWPAGPIFKKGKPFGGKAEAYLSRLATEIIPGLENELDIEPDERWFIGVSLAGLFGVWSAARMRLFTRVAAISGSFWYPAFTDWLSRQTVTAKQVYLSLGDTEPQSKNPHLKQIGIQTEAVCSILREKGIPTNFEWTEGSHFSPVVPRLDKALAALTASLRCAACHNARRLRTKSTIS